MVKKSFMQGAVILGAAGIIIKIMGAFFRIPLGNLIGAEGMGYYQTAYPIYVLFLTLAVSGTPIAISKMVSESMAIGNYHEAHKIFRVSFILLFCIGIVSASICFFGADLLVTGMGNSGAKYAMMAIAPALVFLPIAAAYRGYFQGMQDMKPTAKSQIVEQFFRVTIGLSLAYIFVKYGKEYAAAGASFGATAGAVASIITIAIIYKSRKKIYSENIDNTKDRETESAKNILSRLLSIAVPVTIGAAIMPIMNTIDVTIVMRRLQSTGWSLEQANTMYGQLTGMAAPLINLPQVLTMAVAMSLVPAISSAFKKNDMEFLNYNSQLGMRTSIIIGLPSTFGLMILAEPIMILLYPMQRESAIAAAPCLFIMAIGVLFLSTFQTMTGVLQGIGKQSIPVRNLFFGAIAKVVISYVLIGIPEINVKGAAIGTVAAYVIATLLNYLSIRKYTGIKFDLKITLLKPISAGIVMAITTWLVFRLLVPFLGNNLATVVTVVVAGGIYIIMLFLTRSVTADEVASLPMGAKIIKMLTKPKKGKNN
jgi:stage V sporulation protein B